MPQNLNQQTKTLHQLIKVLFVGTSDFGIPILEMIKSLVGFPLLGCITAPDRPVGRKQVITSSPIKLWAQQNNIPVIQPERIKDPASVQQIKELNPNVIIVAAYGQIIPKEILEIPKYGALNVHPSLLPRWRGASPIHHAILAGDQKTGVTFILMDEEVDHGPIIAKEEIHLGGRETYGELFTLLQTVAAELTGRTLPLWCEKKLTPVPQNDGDATYTKILAREDGKLNWAKSAEELERQVRAFDPWPGNFTPWEMNPGDIIKIKILAVELFQEQQRSQLSYGQTFLTPSGELAVHTGKGALILKRLQLESKTPVTSREFLNGYPRVVGGTFM